MPWTTVGILWTAIVAALLPLDLAALIERLPWILERLAALDREADGRARDDRSRPRQVDDFRSRYEGELDWAA